MEGTLENVPLVRDEVRPRKNRAFSVVEENIEHIPKRRRESVACLESLKQPVLSHTRLVLNVIPCKIKIPSHDVIKSSDSYGEEIFEYLCRREKKFVIDTEVLKMNDPKCLKYRSLLIDWIIFVAHKLTLSQETLYLAVSLIDRTLAMDGDFYSRIQLVGVAALFLVSKLEEYFPANISDLLKLSKNRFEKNDILDMEKELLRLHQFEILGVEPMTFINRLILVSENFREDEDFKEATIFLYDTMLSSKFYSMIRCSLISAGAVCGALSLYQGEWTRSFSFSSKYEVAQVAPIAYKMLIKVYHMKTEMPDAARDGIRNKYLSKSQHRRIFESAYFEETNLLKAISNMSKIIKTVPKN